MSPTRIEGHSLNVMTVKLMISLQIQGVMCADLSGVNIRPLLPEARKSALRSVLLGFIFMLSVHLQTDFWQVRSQLAF